ncbi:TY-Chap2 family putative peptide chaperone [Crystallibacter crystallopoietes]|uniref:TY-Chap2 family putative peptide chaperone n=1 Tax=Crystallibacter crystallopoietes TaxID=37928 RepID=UPI001237879C|nr:hypothetical protein [Arthrobacter crystallopoietes]
MTTMTSMVDGLSFSQRFIRPQSWWILTELCRRHPEFRIVETHPGDGHYDCLGLYDDRSKVTALNLNRGGSLHIHRGVNPGSFGWATAFSGDSFEFIENLESRMGLNAPSATSPTTARLLCYRVITSVLLQSLNARKPWDAQCLEEVFWGDDGKEKLVAEFPGIDAHCMRSESSYLDGPISKHWVLRRKGVQPELVLNDDGMLYQRNKRSVDLYKVFKVSGRSISSAIGASLGEVLK